MRYLKKTALVGIGFVVFCTAMYFVLSAGRGSMFSGDKLTADELAYLKNLGLLKEGEQVLLISGFSDNDLKREGQFYTDKRIAAYLQTNDTAQDFTYLTYYPDICNLDFTKGDLLMSSPPSSILVTRCDGSSFRVYLNYEGSDEFYEGVRKMWQQRTAK